MFAFLLGAGNATRLRPLSEFIPKALTHVAGKPVSRWLVEDLVAQGFPQDKIVLCINEKEQVQFAHEFRDMPGIKWMTSAKPLGTAGEITTTRIKEAGLGDALKEPFLVVYADDLTKIDYKAMKQFHKENKATVTLAATDKVPLEFGLVYRDPYTSKVVRFHEKPYMSELKQNCWTGRAIIEPNVAGTFKEGHDLARHVFPHLLKLGLPLFVFQTHEIWLDVGSVSHLRMANELYGRE